MNKTNKKFKDPGSAITHLIAMIGAVICAFPLIGKAVHTNNSIVVFAMSVFISSMILLYGASTLYHSLDISKKVNLFFRRIDHSMIFVLIAGSYTPVCLLALDRKQGIPLLVLVWATAWLLAGGIIYTVGGIIYGLKLPIFDKLPKDFGSHEIFHLFVMGGSICHFIFMYAYLM